MLKGQPGGKRSFTDHQLSTACETPLSKLFVVDALPARADTQR